MAAFGHRRRTHPTWPSATERPGRAHAPDAQKGSDAARWRESAAAASIAEPHYPFHDKTIVVTNYGRLCLYRKKVNLSTCPAGQAVGIKEVDDGIWLFSFMDYDLGTST